ncbi:MAG: (2Fe-2S) ferredoxin domain-containing protein [Thermomicrobium sp.]|nr:(2Fe-2S) ferredoxin domain-containing protein [Thermomicrobium sp.]MDW8007232.1 (2Fe-2S) ferredoxin domain-containing protein [Thermomicrobium sp.]
MYWCRLHVLVCTANHCTQKGAQQVAARLRLELKRAGLDGEIMVNTCDSIDLCDIGPNIVVYPQGWIYRNVQVSDLPELIESLRAGDRPVERLLLRPDSEDEARRRALYREAVEQEPLSVEAFAALAERYGFDEAWVAEQARRGFIARKPGEGGDRITVTSKARHRYGLASDE